MLNARIGYGTLVYENITFLKYDQKFFKIIKFTFIKSAEKHKIVTWTT